MLECESLGIAQLARSCHSHSWRLLLFPLQELLEDESNQLFFGEVGKQMVIGLMTKAEKVGSLKVAYVSCGHRDTCSSSALDKLWTVKGENFVCI